MTNTSYEVSLGFVTWVVTSTADWTLQIEDEMKLLLIISHVLYIYGGDGW